ncbi:Fic family protein, partial [Candidatus Curtissbacteria bacterium]|nr:Fic family protein [Candidatus Curtissbacteria bacterium]
IQDIINYREVLAYIDDVAKKEGKLTEEVLLKIHSLTVDKLLPDDQKGRFRTQQVYVTNSRTGEVSFTPPKPEKVAGEIRYFLDWLNSKESENIHPTLKAGVVHYNLARIHPFVDGNGRTSRACATLVLFLSGYDIKKFFALEEYYDTDAASYYQTLQETSNQIVEGESDRDLTGFLEYFTKGLAVELTRVRERVQHLSSDLRLKKRVGQLALTERQAKIVEYIQSYGKITNREWRSLLPDYSDDTVLRDLKDLIKKKIIKKKGTTKSAAYIMK